MKLRESDQAEQNSVALKNLLADLGWESLHDRRQKHKLVIILKNRKWPGSRLPKKSLTFSCIRTHSL